MLYAFLLYHDPAIPFEPDTIKGHFEFRGQADAHNAYVMSEALGGPDMATTVRVRNGATLVTDGPFAETKEHLGGFYILDCADLDDAIAFASRLPDANGTTEIRPVMRVDGWDYGATAARGRRPME